MKRLHPAARIICALAAHKFHTCRAFCVLSEVHAPGQTQFTLYSRLRARTLRGFLRVRNAPDDFSIIRGVTLCGSAQSSSFAVQQMCSSSSCFCVAPCGRPHGDPVDLIMLGEMNSPAQTRLRRDLRAMRRGAHCARGHRAAAALSLPLSRCSRYAARRAVFV